MTGEGADWGNVKPSESQHQRLERPVDEARHSTRVPYSAFHCRLCPLV